MHAVRCATCFGSLVLASLVLASLIATPSNATVIWREVVDGSTSASAHAESAIGKEFFSDWDAASWTYPANPLPLEVAISAEVPHAGASAQGMVDLDRVRLNKSVTVFPPDGISAWAQIGGVLHRRFEVPNGRALTRVEIPLRVSGTLLGDAPYAEWEAGVVGVSMVSGSDLCFSCTVDTTFTWSGVLAPGSYVFEMSVSAPDFEGAGESAHLSDYTIRLVSPNAAPAQAERPGPAMLSAAFPNPASETCALSLLASQEGAAEVRVIDVRGRAVRSLLDETVASGRHELEWDLTDDRGHRVPPGVYAIIVNGHAEAAQRVVVVR